MRKRPFVSSCLAALSVITLIAAGARADYSLVDDDDGVAPPYGAVCYVRFPAASAIDAAVHPANPPVAGLAVGYVGPSGLPVYRSYGQSDGADSAPVTGHTLFANGSVTKVFTGTMLGLAAVREPNILTRPVPMPAVGMSGEWARFDDQ